MKHALLLEALGISSSLIVARGLQPYAEAGDLEVAEEGANGKPHLLIPAAADAWRHMKAAAANDDVTLVIVSAFRSIDRQAELIRRKLEAGQKLEDIFRVSAPPGYSQHHTGRAIDIGTPGACDLQAAFDATPAFAWLQQHAGAFGFTLTYPRGNRYGYEYEPWHWCYAARQDPS